jgi:hypothetical protein
LSTFSIRIARCGDRAWCIFLRGIQIRRGTAACLSARKRFEIAEYQSL